jgi:hypothetical protein
MPNPYVLWSLWRELLMLLRLFFLILTLVAVYTMFSASFVVVRLRSLTNQHNVMDASSLRCSLAALRDRAENIRQMVGATFYFYGFIFFLTLPRATVTLDYSRTPLLALILRNFLVDFAFAANIFSVFVVLYSVQWFVSSRVNACAIHLNAQDIA